MIDLKYNTNLKIYNTKANWSASEITLLLSCAVLLLSSLFSKQRFTEIFPFLNNNCGKTDNVRAGTEIVNPCISITYHQTYQVVTSVSYENITSRWCCVTVISCLGFINTLHFINTLVFVIAVWAWWNSSIRFCSFSSLSLPFSFSAKIYLGFFMEEWNTLETVEPVW